MIKYEVNCYEYGLIKSYGISIFDDNVLIRQFPCITENKKDMQRLAKICNELELDVCHIEDIIEDYLTDFDI